MPLLFAYNKVEFLAELGKKSKVAHLSMYITGITLVINKTLFSSIFFLIIVAVLFGVLYTAT